MDGGARPRARDVHRFENDSEPPPPVGIKLKPMTSPFQNVKHFSKWPVWCLIVGGLYVLGMCLLVGIGLGMTINQRGLTQKEYMECTRIAGEVLSVQQSKRFPTGSVKTLTDFITTKKLPQTLLTHSDMEFCPGIPEPATDELYRVPEKVKMLMIIGTQKTGTTWLFEALNRHPSFIAALRRPGEDSALAAGSLRAKEPQYFNRWPLPPVGDYLHAWHSGVIGAMVSDSAGRRVLMDASPQYLMNAAAPARIQAVMPHAKFIMVVRDGPIRTYSDWLMMSRIPSCAQNPSRLCPISTSFLEQVEYELNDPKFREDCYFNGTDPKRTWWDCHRCHYGYIDQSTSGGACAEAERSGPAEFRTCVKPAHTFLDHGLYAAQLAWWLRFFPPEQFLIVSSWQLRDPIERIRVLNRIIQFTGMAGAQLFTPDMLNNVVGFPGNYTTAAFTANETQGLAQLREFFRKPQEDLRRLVHTFWPDEEFHIDYET